VRRGSAILRRAFILAGMTAAVLALRFDPAVVVLSYLTAAFASYVALDLAQRVRTPDALMARVWWIAGSLSMGTGIWAMHFVGRAPLVVAPGIRWNWALVAASAAVATGAAAAALVIFFWLRRLSASQ